MRRREFLGAVGGLAAVWPLADFRKALALDAADESVKKNLKELGVTP